MASPQQEAVIRSLFVWASQCCYSRFTATVYEDVLRGELLDGGLSAGWTIAVNKGTPIRDVTFSSAAIIESPSAFGAVPGHNPDVRIAAPVRLVAELKIRGIFGSSATRPVANLSDDFDHVAQRRADVLILASDLKSYNSLRVGSAAITFSSELPDSALLSGQPTEFPVVHGTLSGVSLAQLVCSPFGERVVSAFFLRP